jgi:hypothetical protein
MAASKLWMETLQLKGTSLVSRSSMKACDF